MGARNLDGAPKASFRLLRILRLNANALETVKLGLIIERRWLNTIPLTTYVVNLWAEGALPDGTVVLVTTTLTSNIDITEEVSF